MKLKQDSQTSNLIKEQQRIEEGQINLIASESYAPQAVLDVVGSILTDKYSEGYPDKRYYPGNEIYDKLESLVQKRALDLFKLSSKTWNVNVQSYSGAIANGEIYSALLEPGDTILALDLSAGGHLSHGSRASITSKWYTIYHYGVDANYRINYVQLEKLATQHKPKLIISGASAYPFKINFRKISEIAKKVGALHLADISHYAGLISAGVYPSPFLYADVVMSTTHKSLFGPRGAIIWSRTLIAKKIDRAVFPGMQGGPHMNTIAGIGVGLGIAKKSKAYYARVAQNAKALSAAFKKLGGAVIGGGTESHVILLDARPLGLHGGEVEYILEQVGILANRNAIAGDVSVQEPSAIRMGTYAVTQRGMKSKQMSQIAILVYKVVSGEENILHAQQVVRKLTRDFPIKR